MKRLRLPRSCRVAARSPHGKYRQLSRGGKYWISPEGKVFPVGCAPAVVGHAQFDGTCTDHWCFAASILEHSGEAPSMQGQAMMERLGWDFGLETAELLARGWIRQVYCWFLLPDHRRSTYYRAWASAAARNCGHDHEDAIITEGPDRRSPANVHSFRDAEDMLEEIDRLF